MTSRRKAAALAGGLIAVAAGGWVALRPAADAPPPPAAAATEPGVVSFAPNAPELDMVSVAPAAATPLPVSADLGARVAVDEAVTARVSSPVTGRIIRILADVGQSVAAGQALAVLDSPDLGQAGSDLSKARADAQLKREALARARDLYAGQAIARRELEAAEADAAESAAELRRAALRFGNLGGGAGDALTLRTPVGGVVVDRQANPGQQLQPGQGPLFTVSDPSRLWLLVDLPESALGRAKIGQTVDFTVDAFPNRRFAARVVTIAPEVDPTTRRVQLRATVSNPDRALRPEMFARARLVTDDGRTAVAVPNAALIESGVKTYVFVEDRPGRFRRVPVAVAERGADVSYIAAGLPPGRRVVGEGALLLNAQLAGAE